MASDNHVFIRGEVIRETAKAVLIRTVKGHEIWFPFSVASIEDQGISCLSWFWDKQVVELDCEDYAE